MREERSSVEQSAISHSPSRRIPLPACDRKDQSIAPQNSEQQMYKYNSNRLDCAYKAWRDEQLSIASLSYNPAKPKAAA